jgi:dienelactone hydrolase
MKPRIASLAVFPWLLMAVAPASIASPADHASSLCAASSRTDAVQTRRATLAGVPVMVRMPAHVSRPPILLWHGFGPPASEAAMMEALPLDDVPAVKVYLGLPLFGDRAPAGGMKELARRQAEDLGLQVFKPVVVGAGDELPGVARALQQQGCLKPGEAIGLVGFSAGGAAALYALSQRRLPVASAVLINASTGLTASVQAFEQATGKTYAWSPASRELARQTDAVDHASEIAAATPPPALLFLRGAEDSVIDTQATTDLEARLKPQYRDHAQRLEFRQLQGVPHQWAADPQALANVRRAVADWFVAH